MLDPKTRELISIAASVVAKCQPCLDYHVEEARKAGASDSDMRNAVSIARMIRKQGDENMDKYADEKLGGMAQEQQAPSACCCSGGSCSGE
ncbi:carboxymuconolactone decarboxylase family protein [bacterium]|nr:carboxymuconolactone decarboxylase family protein [bacterium]